jgi:hypothetical protein
MFEPQYVSFDLASIGFVVLGTFMMAVVLACVIAWRAPGHDDGDDKED